MRLRDGREVREGDELFVKLDLGGTSEVIIRRPRVYAFGPFTLTAKPGAWIWLRGHLLVAVVYLGLATLCFSGAFAGCSALWGWP
jgi:hypothetical protein